MAFGKKKKDADAGLDVLEELKEPFSFSNFFEEQVVERWRKLRKFLDEKGILFFLLSPFQQRNRLILELFLIVVGILIGIVPRSANLIQAARERNAASELAALLEDDAQFTIGRITVRPLGSSQYEDQHLLAFLITGSGNQMVPSTASRYTVDLSPARGVLDGEHVTYSYNVLPISEDQRLLLLYTDHRQQDDNTGIYNLTVQVTVDDLPAEEVTPIEVVLSDTQETNALFNDKGVDLATLTDRILDDESTPITDAKTSLDEALDDYQLEVERIENLPVDGELAVTPTLDELTTWTQEHTLYPDLTDNSTTEDIKEMTEATQTETLQYPAQITYNGVTYQDPSAVSASPSQEETPSDTVTVTPGDEAQVTEEGTETQNTATPEEELVMEQVSSLQTRVTNVVRALTTLNNAGQTKFQTLDDLRLTLNQTIDVSSFPETGTVSEPEA